LPSSASPILRGLLSVYYFVLNPSSLLRSDIEMATAIRAASGVLALTIFAFKASKSLYEAVSSFKSKSKDIHDIQTDLETLITVVGSIRQQAQGSENESKLEPLRKPIECCTKTCQEMQEMLKACTKHTKDGRDSVRDWLNMRYHEKSFNDFKRQLASYKSTLSVTFASINMCVSV
jgi:Fungal N-terminal domain of STAND proteins